MNTIKHKLTQISIRINDASLLRTEVLDGRDMLVVPTIMLKEGVLNDLLYPEEEISKIPAAWNGRPVPVYHPDENGVPVSSSSPEVVEASVVGTVFNTIFEDGSLKAELWIDKEKADKVDGSVLTMLESGAVMDVSTGLFLDVDETAGTWNGQSYSGIARNYIPDHLALLPGEIGACSVEDGCGTPRINKTEGEPMDKKEKVGKFEKIINLLKTVVKTPGLQENEISHEEVRQNLRKALEIEATGDYFWVVDVFDKYFIYEQTNDSFQGQMLFKRSYTVNDRDEVFLVQDAIEVKIETQYVPVTSKSGMGPGSIKDVINDNKPKEIAMNKVETLIANEKSPFTEEDKEMLMGLSECQLTKIATPYEVEVKTNTEEEILVVPEALSKEDIVAIVTETMTSTMAANAKVGVIARLTANESCSVSPEGLAIMTESDLISLEIALSPVDSVDFSGRPVPTFNSDTDELVPLECERVVTADAQA